MGAEIISTDQTGQYTIGSTVFAVLMPDVSLTVSANSDPGFLADHDSNFTLTVLGQAVTFGTTARLGQTASATMLAAVTVGEGGLLQSLTAYGIDMRRSGSRIDNDGVISGGNEGVIYAAGVDGAELSNSGTIASVLGGAILVTGATGGSAPSLFNFINTGTLDAATDGVSVAHESLSLTNHGDIIAFGTGIALTDDPTLENTLTLVNTGLVQGATTALSATGHADSVTNSGTFLGAVLLGAGDNLFDNSGTTTGAVSAGAGDDTLSNTGVVSGAVNLGGGANTVTNLGRLEAGLTLADGDDWLYNEGTILGDVALGDGANTATLLGTVTGGLTSGANEDSIVIRGLLGGDIALGNGADSLVLKGSLDGDIDMGAGIDDVFLGVNAQIDTGTLDGGSGDDALTAKIDVEDVFNFEFINLKGSANTDVVADAIDNTIYGNRGNNEIDGGAGDDVIYGRSGSDLLLGGLGADYIGAGSGADELVGGAGGDTLKGGSGKDTFVYEATTDSLKSDADEILDFDRGRDKLDLSGLADDAISWLGDGILYKTGNAQARYKVRDDYVEMRVDLDGNGSVDMTVVLDGLTKLSASDFLL